MKLENERELANTRRKLREVEERYEAALRRTFANPQVREATIRSLGQLVEELKEQIAQYETRQPASR